MVAVKITADDRRAHVVERHGWLFCETCQFMFAPGHHPGTPKQRARFLREHAHRRRRRGPEIGQRA